MDTARVSVGQVREQLAETLNQVAYRGERIIIERRGKDVAALVPMEDVELLRALEDRIDIEEARAALKEAETGNTVSWEEVKAELGL
jgi:prevent-host-death family protein